ncbi:MAG: MopE-related protein [Deltaproteobacteria bacterium]|nr:MopE-related protein [Deltaproteobacteria bacterium]
MSNKFLLLSFFIIFSFSITACDDDSTNTNNQTCEGEAPLASKTTGVCTGQVKICTTNAEGEFIWSEPDYTSIANYEETEESCDNLDNDCDGEIDEGLAANTYYRDNDGDGYGITSDATEACALPEGFAENDGDCDDDDSDKFPGNPEVCDGKDNNCDEQIDEELTEVCYSGDGGCTETSPGSGTFDCQGSCSTGTSVCTDGQWSNCQNQVVPEPETCNNLDEDCNGLIDDNLERSCYPGPAGTEGVGICTSGTQTCSTGSWSSCSGEVLPAPETCNGLDDNCDGQTDEGVLNTYYRDSDSDGYGLTTDATQACSLPTGFAINIGDCDDSDNEKFPGNPEVCDSKDNNCDGQIDEGVLTTYYRDNDDDDYGLSTDTSEACSLPAGFATDNGDCDDGDNQKYPGNTEVCDGKDNNCDSQIDEGVLITYYRDSDGDGYGLTTDATQACSLPAGFATDNGDCDDGDNQKYPGNTEVCDGKDNNCNSQIDEGVLTSYYRDNDGDGYGLTADATQTCSLPAGFATDYGDCNDENNLVNPGATEECNGIDDDCNGVIDNGFALSEFYYDADGDGYGDAANLVEACVAPSGYVNNSDDCNDSNPDINPDALEICDSLDNNCDGIFDAGICQPNSSCWDNSQTQNAVCKCDSGYLEDPNAPDTCLEAQYPANGSLAISEIMINPELALVADGQYFEIFNPTDATILINGSILTVDSVSYPIPDSPTMLAGPGVSFTVGPNDETASNGDVNIDILFATMPILSENGTIIIESADATPILIDQVTWDASWRHQSGHSLSLSSGALDLSPDILNDLRLSWCSSRPSQYNGMDYGTPGLFNEPCLVESCILAGPLQQVIEIGQSTDQIYGQVYESGVTDSAGQGTDLAGQLGYGTRHSIPDSSWTWIDATYSGDATDYDEYVGTMTPEGGVYDYTYRFSMDDGLTWRNCDSAGNDSYDHTLSGVLTVSATDCTDGGTECSDCIDNNGDGLIDGDDPTCISSSDDNEGQFQTDIPGDNPNDIYGYHDCFIDGNSGAGDDGCQLDPCCLIGNNDQYCIDNPPTDCYDESNPHYNPAECIQFCEPYVPVGCDCWGCCTICVDGVCDNIFTAETVSPGCTVDTFHDPDICIRCTPSTECGEPCDPNLCIVCPGMTLEELPDHCITNECPNGMDNCGPTARCDPGYYCLNNCCTPEI